MIPWWLHSLQRKYLSFSLPASALQFLLFTTLLICICKADLQGTISLLSVANEFKVIDCTICYICVHNQDTSLANKAIVINVLGILTDLIHPPLFLSLLYAIVSRTDMLNAVLGSSPEIQYPPNYNNRIGVCSRSRLNFTHTFCLVVIEIILKVRASRQCHHWSRRPAGERTVQHMAASIEIVIETVPDVYTLNVSVCLDHIKSRYSPSYV